MRIEFHIFYYKGTVFSGSFYFAIQNIDFMIVVLENLFHKVYFVDKWNICATILQVIIK